MSCTPKSDKTNISTENKDQSQDFELPPVQRCGHEVEASDYKDWTLIFEDNFDTDLSNWNAWESGAFNEELQYYQSKNLKLDNGLLYITAIREKASGATDPFNTIKRTLISHQVE